MLCWQRLQNTAQALREHRVNGSLTVQLNLAKGQIAGWEISVSEHQGVSLCVVTSSS